MRYLDNLKKDENMTAHAAILDANLNRVSEGLRVIEEYCRFIAANPELSEALAGLRHRVNQLESTETANLNARHTERDARANELPAKRADLKDLLRANFKRVEEGLRVLEEYDGNTEFNRMRYVCYDLEKTIVLTLLKPLIQPGIYLISDEIEVLKKGLDWGVSLIQLRAKSETKAEIYNKAGELKSICKSYQTPFILNDHVDIAIAVDADGVHTGQDDMPISEIRKLFGPHKLIGRTTHTLDQGQQAKKEGADYVSVGPIWETPSKPGRSGIGLDYLKEAPSLALPYVAIGGINLSNLEKITPFRPPLIGLIRDYKNIPEIKKLLKLNP